MKRTTIVEEKKWVGRSVDTMKYYLWGILTGVLMSMVGITIYAYLW